jgi:hypothetical protein
LRGLGEVNERSIQRVSPAFKGPKEDDHLVLPEPQEGKKRLQSELRKQKNTKLKRQSLMLRRQPNRGADVKAEAEDKVHGGNEGGEGLWRVCLMNLGQRRLKGSQSCCY